MKKKILNILLVTLSVFFLVIIYEVTNISNKTVNRKIIDIDLNNARNPQVKKILRFFDNVYTLILLKFDNNSKLYFSNKDGRDNIPDEKIIFKTLKFSDNLYPKENNGKSWLRNYGNSASNRDQKL